MSGGVQITGGGGGLNANQLNSSLGTNLNGISALIIYPATGALTGTSGFINAGLNGVPTLYSDNEIINSIALDSPWQSYLVSVKSFAVPASFTVEVGVGSAGNEVTIGSIKLDAVSSGIEVRKLLFVPTWLIATNRLCVRGAQAGVQGGAQFKVAWTVAQH